jgi:DNA polymerase-3 subunit epsilon
MPRPITLDLETTGTEDDARIVQIGIIDSDGNTLMDQLINPEMPIPAEATKIHAITDERVKDAPTFAEVIGILVAHLHNREIIAYNSDFEKRVLESEWKRAQLDKMPELDFYCAMKLYARFVGDWNSYRHDFKWHKLTDACTSEGIEVEESAHSAIGDCQRTLALIKKMAAQVEPEPSAKKDTDKIPF